jgi:hypothetical protein
VNNTTMNGEYPVIAETILHGNIYIDKHLAGTSLLLNIGINKNTFS